MNADDDQRADDLERVLDEGALKRAAKMAGKWSEAHAQIALGEVQARNDAHRSGLIKDGRDDATAIDLSSFARRDDELTSLRRMLAA
jgi:hypothetical protein